MKRKMKRETSPPTPVEPQRRYYLGETRLFSSTETGFVRAFI
ncbi:MAG TPA: hypothetical protein PKA63_08620 [Oligoflexia bacterium]|nr:hypothetical protein [Oligoflexia bacterium]